MSDSTEQADIIDWAFAYRTTGSYPRPLSKDQKRAVKRCVLSIEVDNGQVYVQKQKKRVRILNSILPLILQATLVLGKRGGRSPRGSTGKGCHKPISYMCGGPNISEIFGPAGPEIGGTDYAVTVQS